MGVRRVIGNETVRPEAGEHGVSPGVRPVDPAAGSGWPGTRSRSALARERLEEDFSDLLESGRVRGFLTQDDLMSLVRHVELSHELICELVVRVRSAGIEFIEEMEDTVVVPLPGGAGPVAAELVAPEAPWEPDDNPPGPGAIAPGMPEPPPEAPPGTRDGAVATPTGKRGHAPSKPVPPDRRPRRSVAPSAAAVGYEADRFGGVGADPVHTYLKEIGRVKLLDAALEIELAERIVTGTEAAARIAADSERSPERPARERSGDVRLVRRGQAAKEALIEANLRLVVSIAKRYRNRGLAFLDLIQEGNLGLMRAVEKFDHTKGFKFSTYATWWIRQAITRAIADQARTIRIPVHMVETINKVVWAQRQLLQELGREPTAEELAQRVDFTIERIREIQRINQDTVSLEQPMGDEEDFSLSDLIEDRAAVVPDDAAARMMLDAAVREALAHLAPREQDVVRLRFGLEDGRIRTLEEVGQAFGVTRERIRQIEAKTLAKLRRPDSAQLLRDYLDEA